MAKQPAKTTDSKTGKGASVNLSAPWHNVSEIPRLGNVARGPLRSADLKNFVDTRSQLHAIYIQEIQRTRRIGMVLASALLGLACVIPLIAPTGRETLSYWIGATLFIFAAGSMGYTRVKMASKTQQLSLTKGEDDAQGT